EYYMLQILDDRGRWRDFRPIQAKGLTGGRGKADSDPTVTSSMAVRHLRFRYDRSKLLVEPLVSLNGVYRRIRGPVEIGDGMRFRIGDHVIEFQRADPLGTVQPLRSEDGEVFWSREVEPIAYLALIRPDDRPGLRFPITARGCTVIGRDKPGVSITLPDDPL